MNKNTLKKFKNKCTNSNTNYKTTKQSSKKLLKLSKINNNALKRLIKAKHKCGFYILQNKKNNYIK